jgi:hypothetical protein
MFADIIRLNGGVRALKPGMVLRLPQKRKNEDIFVSNDWAAYQGMATVPDLQDFYASNPFGSSATAAMNSGAWSPGGVGATNPMGTPRPPAAPGATTAPTVPVPNGANRTKDDLSTAANSYGTPVGTPVAPPPPAITSDIYRRQAGNAQALNVPGPKPQTIPGAITTPGYSPIQPMANTVPTQVTPRTQQPQAQRVTPAAGQGWEQAQRAAGYKNANPMNGNFATPLPAGATVTGQQKPTATGQAGAKVAPMTPQQAYGLNPNYPVAQTALNTSPETMAYTAPYVKDALAALYFSSKAPNGMATIKLSQVDMLVQAGLLVKGTTQYDAAYALASGNPTPSPYNPNGGSGAGFWDPFSAPAGQKYKAPKPMGGGKKGGGGGGNSTGLSKWAGSSYGTNIGPSLGLMQWRMNI